eukprot:jgi/Ulvmu1/12/UM001_0012.1
MINYQLGQSRTSWPTAHGRGQTAAPAARSSQRSSSSPPSCRGDGAIARATPANPSMASPSYDVGGNPDPDAAEPLVIGTAMNNLTTAIQAYAAPLTGMEFSCRGENGTLTQFLSPDFVQERFKALLQVTVKNGTGFDDADIFSKPDLYVKLAAGDSYAQTGTVKDKRNPEWNETFVMWPEQYGEDDLFGAPTLGPPLLRVTVFDEDWGFGKTIDDRLGHGEVQLPDDWENLNKVEHKVEIKDSNEKVRGHVYLTIDAFSLSDEAKEEGARKAGGEGSEATSVAAAAFASMKPKHGMRPGDSPELARSVAAAAVMDPSMADRMATAADATEGATLVPVEAAEDAVAAEADKPDKPDKLATRKKLFEAWEALGKAFPDAFISEGEAVAFINAEATTDVQAFVHRNTRLKQIVIAFRGSQSIMDWTTDGSFSMEPITACRKSGALRTLEDAGMTPDGGILRELRKLLPTKDAAVHVGFYYAVRSVEPQVREIVDMISGGDPEWEITVTGHSLGAALATICAYSLATSCNFNYKLECYPFGSPRIGNRAFIEEFNAAVPRTFQFQVDNDIVSQLPPFLAYADVSNECRVLDGGRVELREGMPVSVFGMQPVSDEVRQKLVAPLTATEQRNRKALSEADGQFFQSLLSMEGGTPHLPDTYLRALAEVMLTASSGERFEDMDAVQKMRDAFKALGESNKKAETA